MHPRLYRLFSTARAGMTVLTNGPQVLAFLPAFVLAGFWIGGEVLLVITALAFPAILAIVSTVRIYGKSGARKNAEPSALVAFENMLESALKTAREKARKTACLIVEIDDFDKFVDRHGKSAAEIVMKHAYQQVGTALRNRDQVFRLNEKQIGVCVAPVEQLSIDAGLLLAARLQTAVAKPVTLGGTSLYLSASVGLCHDTHIGSGGGKDLAQAATLALENARHNGPSAIRVYSMEMGQIKPCSRTISTDIERALENGEIHPWFQPQISTDTGLITGFEALARWEHPDRGLIPPADFLPSIQQAGRMERLSEVMLFNSLTALKAWDALDLIVPHIGVNFASDELRNPRLVEKIEWELDRFELTPDRLAIEILETVIAASPDDTIVRNINNLAELGCFIDLDDFGTGHASISSIRRFAIQRLKIDRSFITKMDRDAEQQRMVSAILLMAERLELDTIAEGVETAGEHAMLSQLGCGHVQGFGIGRPMPFEKTAAWATNHLAKLSKAPTIGRQTG